MRKKHVVRMRPNPKDSHVAQRLVREAAEALDGKRYRELREENMRRSTGAIGRGSENGRVPW